MPLRYGICLLGFTACTPAIHGGSGPVDYGRLLPGTVLINEIMFAPDHCPFENRTAQWFEVRSLTDEPVELGEMLLLNSRFETAAISPHILEPYGYALVGRGDSDLFCDNGTTPHAYFDGSMQLDPAGEALALVDATTQEFIDGTPAFDTPLVIEGYSVCASPDALTASANDFQENWFSMASCPGEQNETPAAMNTCGTDINL